MMTLTKPIQKGISTARFWQFINNDWVKLTIKAGQRLSWYRGEHTDEGYSAEYSTWDFDGIWLVEEYGTRGRDCDGGHSSGGERRAHITKLQSKIQSHAICKQCKNQAWIDRDLECYDRSHKGLLWIEEPSTPLWTDRDDWQRDESAERAGY